MPLTSLQKMVAKVLSPYRTASNFVGGGAALNRQWARISDDLDIYADHRSLPKSAELELEALRKQGFSVDITVSSDATVEAIVKKYGFETLVQWMDDPEASLKFYPAIYDEEFGYRLHEADNAVNKVLCTARRDQAARDAVDLVTIVNNYAPLGPLVWAVCGKDPELNPITIVQQIRKNAFGYADVELRAVRKDGEPVTRDQVREILGAALDRAEKYCDEVAPLELEGRLFVNSLDLPIEATAGQIADKTAHARPIKQFRTSPKFPDGS